MTFGVGGGWGDFRLGFAWLRMRSRGVEGWETQIPFGNDDRKGNGKSKIAWQMSVAGWVQCG
jgi:hypothetical protein